MRMVTLLIAILAVVGVSCANTAKEPNVQLRPITVTSTLLDERYELFGAQAMKMPLGENSYLAAKSGDTEIQIRNAQEFAQIVKGVTSPEQALELARLLTSPAIRPFLQDIYYSEVHKKAADEKERWFAVEPEQYEQLNLDVPIVTKENDRYKIERCVAAYPRIQGKQVSKAQLLRIWEWVDAAGKYTSEIQVILAEGESVEKLLLFTK